VSAIVCCQDHWRCDFVYATPNFVLATSHVSTFEQQLVRFAPPSMTLLLIASFGAGKSGEGLDSDKKRKNSVSYSYEVCVAITCVRSIALPFAMLNVVVLVHGCVLAFVFVSFAFMRFLHE
jgi:hypothetical protein